MSSGHNTRSVIGGEETVPRILAFHKIVDGITFGAINFSPRRFKRLLGFLVNSGFEFREAHENASAPSGTAMPGFVRASPPIRTRPAITRARPRLP